MARPQCDTPLLVVVVVVVVAEVMGWVSCKRSSLGRFCRSCRNWGSRKSGDSRTHKTSSSSTNPQIFLSKWESSWRTCMYVCTLLLHFVLVVSKQIFVFLVQKFSLMMSSFFLSVHDLVYFVGIMWASIDQCTTHSFETCCYACLRLWRMNHSWVTKVGFQFRGSPTLRYLLMHCKNQGH